MRQLIVLIFCSWEIPFILVSHNLPIIWHLSLVPNSPSIGNSSVRVNSKFFAAKSSKILFGKKTFFNVRLDHLHSVWKLSQKCLISIFLILALKIGDDSVMIYSGKIHIVAKWDFFETLWHRRQCVTVGVTKKIRLKPGHQGVKGVS